MNTMQLVVILLVMLLISVMLGIGVGSIIVFLKEKNAKTERSAPLNANENTNQKWSIELWDIERGIRFSSVFCGGITLGRTIPGWIPNGILPVGEDQTISQEQSLIYEQGEFLYLWNLGKTNPTRLNDTLVIQPEPLRVGDRITMGDRRFLLTSLVRV